MGLDGLLIAQEWPESSASVLAFRFGREDYLRTRISQKKKTNNELSTHHLGKGWTLLLDNYWTCEEENTKITTLQRSILWNVKWNPSMAVSLKCSRIRLYSVIPCCVLVFLVMKCFLRLFSLIGWEAAFFLMLLGASKFLFHSPCLLSSVLFQAFRQRWNRYSGMGSSGSPDCGVWDRGGDGGWGGWDQPQEMWPQLSGQTVKADELKIRSRTRVW